jgi:hypothetical protein
MTKWVAPILFLAVVSLHAQTLKPATIAAWGAYIAHAESQMGADLKATDRERSAMSAGNVYIRRVDMPGAKLDGGLIHHWLGGIFLPGAKIKPLQVWMKDYDAHSKYFAEIERSKLLSHEGNTFKIYYRFKRKKIITVYYNTEHTVVYQPIEAGRTTSKSVATRIAEIDNPGAKDEREMPIGDDSGFLWRLNSYWRFQETPGGVFLECESISLSRGIPVGLAWMIKGFVESVPRESLESTLTSIRKGFKPE